MRPWLLAVVVLLAGCRTDSTQLPGITVACTISPQPPRVGNATVTVTLSDRAAKPLTGALVKLEADMAHPGMAPVLVRTGESAPGSYVGHLEFTMAGDWVILVQGALATGQKIDRQVDVKGVLPG